MKLLGITADHVRDGSAPRAEIEKLIEFFKGYADQGHHAKEEEIFFEYLYRKEDGFRSETSPIAIFREDHVNGRRMVTRISRVDEDYPFHVNDYSMMLRRHIEMEDELFPTIAEQHLTENEVLSMETEFQQADAQRDLASKLALLDKVEVFLI